MTVVVSSNVDSSQTVLKPSAGPLKLSGESAKAPESELISPVVPLENGSA